MKIPDTSPIMNKQKEQYMGKVISHDDTPQYLQKIMSHGREEGKEAAVRHWNDASDFFNKLTKGRDYTGNDQISMMGTYITYFASAWIIFIKTMIADKDEAGVGFNDLIEPIFSGIREIIINAKVEVNEKGGCRNCS
jgi:hypothetical protein